MPRLRRCSSTCLNLIARLLRKVGSRRLPGYDKIVGDVAHRLSARRKELFESSFYASIRMGALDALLCF